MRKEEINELPSLVIKYLNYLSGTLNKSELTVLEYGSDLRLFYRFLLKNKNLVNDDTEFEKIDIKNISDEFICNVSLDDVYSFLAYCRNERKNDSNARARKAVAIKRFYLFLEAQNMIKGKNMIALIDLPQKKKSLPKYLTLQQSISLLKAVEGENSYRDYCILVLFLNCGLRLAELVAIDFTDISFENKTLRVLGKGNKERIVYLNDTCINALNDYIKVRPKDGVKDRNALFISNRLTRISRESVQKMVEKYLNKIGLGNQGFSVHKLRHTTATLMYQYGNTDVMQIKTLLGHANLATTDIYTHIHDEQVKEAVDNNPINTYFNENEN